MKLSCFLLCACFVLLGAAYPLLILCHGQSGTSFGILWDLSVGLAISSKFGYACSFYFASCRQTAGNLGFAIATHEVLLQRGLAILELG